MEITTTQYNRCDVVKMNGRVDTYTSPKLQETLDGIVESGRYNIILNMSEVDFLSSKGLWVLTETQKKVKSRGRLVLVNTDEKIRKSLDLVGMGEYFDFFDDLTAAVGSF